MISSKYVRISVCMAVCNGEKYLIDQITSILSQMGDDDELVIIDDNSDDNSLGLILGIFDQRIHLFKNSQRLGHVKNFEKVISLARGDYIFLSDQDDVWVEGRLSLFLAELIEVDSPILVVGDFIEVDENLLPISTALNRMHLAGVNTNLFPLFLDIILGRSKFYGCCFAFNRALVRFILPFPPKIEAHDMYIGLVSCLLGSIVSINKITLKRRIHGKNLTPLKRRGFYPIIISRYIYIKEMLFLFISNRLFKY